MPKRSRKNSLDLNQLAASIVGDATAEKLLQKAVDDGKNLAAVVLGRLGGLKGGKARASILPAEKRSEIAKNAANVRWQKNKKIAPKK
jgi:hypothetical protein